MEKVRIETILTSTFMEIKEVRQPGLEPGSSRWQRPIVPLDHWRGTDGLHNLSALIPVERNLKWKLILPRANSVLVICMISACLNDCAIEGFNGAR